MSAYINKILVIIKAYYFLSKSFIIVFKWMHASANGNISIYTKSHMHVDMEEPTMSTLNHKSLMILSYHADAGIVCHISYTIWWWTDKRAKYATTWTLIHTYIHAYKYVRNACVVVQVDVYKAVVAAHYIRVEDHV